MTVTVLRSKNNGLTDLTVEDVSTDLEVDQTSSQRIVARLLKPTIRATVIDGLHRRKALNSLLKEGNISPEMDWLNQPIRMNLQLRRDHKDMNTTEILNLGSHKNKIASTVRSFVGLEQIINGIVSYLRSFAEEHNIRIEDVRPSNLTDEMSTTAIIPNMNRRYARVAKIFAIHPQALKKISDINGEEGVKLGFAHLDNKVYYEIDGDGVLLLLDSVAAYVRNRAANSEKGRFPNLAFHAYFKSAYDVTRQEYNKHGLTRKLDYKDFLLIQIRHSNTRTLSIREVFINTMRIFLNGTRRKVMVKNSERVTRLGSKIKSHFEPPASKKKSKPAQSIGSVAAAANAPSSDPNTTTRAQGRSKQGAMEPHS